jgi:hypothetical protein
LKNALHGLYISVAAAQRPDFYSRQNGVMVLIAKEIGIEVTVLAEQLKSVSFAYLYSSAEFNGRST